MDSFVLSTTHGLDPLYEEKLVFFLKLIHLKWMPLFLFKLLFHVLSEVVKINSISSQVDAYLLSEVSTCLFPQVVAPLLYQINACLSQVDVPLPIQVATTLIYHVDDSQVDFPFHFATPLLFKLMLILLRKLMFMFVLLLPTSFTSFHCSSSSHH